MFKQMTLILKFNTTENDGKMTYLALTTVLNGYSCRTSTSMLDRSERACLCICITMYSFEHLCRDINLCLSDTIYS